MPPASPSVPPSFAATTAALRGSLHGAAAAVLAGAGGSLRKRARSASAPPVRAEAAAAAPPPPLVGLPPALAALLDDVPRLTPFATVGCALAGAAAAAAAAALSPVWPPTQASALLLAAIGIATALLARTLTLERAYAARAAAVKELADPDSRFADVMGLATHYKCARPSDPATPLRFAIACYHGFGAGAFSWGAAVHPLANAAAALVTQHDAPGFGLTARPRSLAPYGLAFNGRLGAAVRELEVGARRGADAAPRALRVLMGHSLGAASAAEEAVRDPGAVDALILVAPAIVAGFGKGDGTGPSGGAARALAALFAGAAAAAMLVAGSIGRFLILLASPVIVTALRGAVRSASFWESGLAAAWAGQPPPTWLVQRYRAPALLAGWEAGLLCFLLARVPLGPGPVAAAKAALAGTPATPAAALARAVAEHGLPTLILHGDRDALVPFANSARLAARLQGATLARAAGRGHTPFEEAPAEFVGVVAAWLDTVAREKEGKA